MMAELVETVEFTALFDDNNPNWQRTSEQNQIFIEVNTNWLNHVLKARGFVFLNDAYEAFGFQKIKEGQLVGWTTEESDYVDVEPYTLDDGHITLTFKVQGEIWQTLPSANQ